MGKSGVSCFRIMSCGRDRVDEDADELGRPEVKSPVDNHRWSFKKRSSRRQIPDNCLISEPKLSIGKKETPRATHDDSHMTASSLNRERLTVAKCLQDTPPLSPPLVDTDVSDLLHTFEDSNKFDSNISESVAVVIQSAVRAYMAGKDLRKRKSVVKLQAAVRGHLARREAIATLRCVQAIVKMQSLVRARRKRLIVRAEAKQNERMDAMGTESFGADQKKYSSTEVLLRNRFARLLLESKPRTKPIYISCEPLKSDSAWKWLERWMDAGCKGLEEEGTEGSNRGNFVASNVTSEYPASVVSSSVLSKTELSNSDGEVESFDGSADFKVSLKFIPERFPRAIVKGEHSQNSADIFAEDPNCPTEKGVEVDTSSPNQSELAAPSDARLDDGISISSDTNNIKGPTALVARGSLLNDDNDPDQVLERLSNSEFVDIKSQHEVPPLSSSSPVDIGSDKATCQSVLSDHQTDVSFASTLDSQDECQCSDVGNILTCKPSEGKENHIYHNSDVAYTSTLGDIEEKNFPEENDQRHDNGESSSINEQRIQPPCGTTNSVSPIEHQAYSSSTSSEMSPTSHARTAESIGTPSSQILTQNNNKTEKRSANRKPKIKLESKEAPVKRNIETNENISSFVPENMKNVKRDPPSSVSEVYADQDPRASISNPLPSYMQTTESARSKFHSSNSPRASHSDSDKDKHTSKRHSLSTGNGSEDTFSHARRTSSPVHERLKRSATHSPQKVIEKRWLR